MTALALYQPKDLTETKELGAILARSGFFADSKEAAQAIVKVIAGAELGFGPVASMTGIYIVKGRVTLSANLMAAAIKRSGKYTYRVTTLTDKACNIEFVENGETIGVSEFTLDDAKAAGLLNNDTWRKYPRNLLFARALSNGARWYTPDIFGGPVYTPDEFDIATDENGDVVEGTIVEQPSNAPQKAVGGPPRADSKQTGTNGGNAPKATVPPPSPTPPTDGDSSQTEPRWNEDKGRVAKFATWYSKRGLNHNEALAALNVDRFSAYAGDERAAMAAISAYIADHAAAADETAPVAWKDRADLLQRIVDAGYANATKHAINVLNRLTQDGKADTRWQDDTAFEAVKLYRKYGEPDAAAGPLIEVAAELGGVQADLLPRSDTTYQE